MLHQSCMHSLRATFPFLLHSFAQHAAINHMLHAPSQASLSCVIAVIACRGVLLRVTLLASGFIIGALHSLLLTQLPLSSLLHGSVTLPFIPLHYMMLPLQQGIDTCTCPCTTCSVSA